MLARRIDPAPTQSCHPEEGAFCPTKDPCTSDATTAANRNFCVGPAFYADVGTIPAQRSRPRETRRPKTWTVRLKQEKPAYAQMKMASIEGLFQHPQALALIDIPLCVAGGDCDQQKRGTCSSRFPKLHDAAQGSSCLPTHKLERQARAAARDSSIVTPVGGCADDHAADCAAPEPTLITSAMEYHSR